MTRSGGGNQRLWELVGWEAVQGMPPVGGNPVQATCEQGRCCSMSLDLCLASKPPPILEASHVPLNDLCSCLKTTTGRASIIVIKEGNHMGASLNNAMS